jgi:ATP-dependent Zn protease
MIAVTQKLREKWVDKNLVQDLARKMEREIQDWIAEKIKKDIEVCKKRGEEGFDIIQRLMKKWYRLDDIKRVINHK